jgi:hypothetical protein
MEFKLTNKYWVNGAQLFMIQNATTPKDIDDLLNSIIESQLIIDAKAMNNGCGKDLFNSHYYEGKPGPLDTNDPHKVTLSFWDINDYQTFLNWWVLGKKSK